MMKFGVDFGTTNTAVVGGVITNDGMSFSGYGEQGQPVPSLIALHPDPEKRPLFGQSVKKQRSVLRREGYTIVSSFKSLLGSTEPVQIGGKSFSPIQITQLFLSFIKKQTEDKAKKEMNEAVFAIPVDFKPEQRRDLRKAAEEAGIKVRSFVSEPTAAYFVTRNDKEIKGASNVAVFDWGGGTLDVSVLSRSGDRILERAVEGESLGGNDIDEILARHVHARVMQGEDVEAPVSFDDLPQRFPESHDQIMERSEDAKVKLSTEDAVPIRLLGGYCHLERRSEKVEVTEEGFKRLISAKVKTAEGVLRRAMEKAGMSLTEFDAILMVGGSCAMRPIVERLQEIGEREMLHGKVYRPQDVQWAIARGAAMLNVESPSYRLEHAFGVLLADDSFYPIFEHGEPAPSAEKKTPYFGVVEDTQEAIFVFADELGNKMSYLKNVNGEKRKRDYVSVPVKGFTANDIHLTASIDEDMIAHVELESGCTTISVEFDRLTFSYHLDRSAPDGAS